MLKNVTITTIVKIITILLQFSFSSYLAYHFGTSAEFDSFSIALNFIVTVNVGFLIAQSKSFIPMLSQNTQDQALIIGQVFRMNIVVFGVLALLIFIFSPQIAHVLAPGVTSQSHEMISELLKILSTYILFSNLLGLTFGLYEFKGLFIQEMFLELARQIILFAVVYLFIHSQGINIISWAHLISLIFIFFLSVFLIKIKLKVSKIWIDSIIKDYLKMIFPLIIASSFVWIMESTNYIIASYFAEGSISSLSYSQKINNNVAQVFAGLMLVIFPILSRSQSKSSFADEFKKAYHLTSFIIILLAFFILLLSPQIVSLLFQQGQFSEASTQNVSSLLRFFFFAIIAGPIGTLIANTYFASRKHELAMRITLISSTASILLSLLFAKYFGLEGIAIATSLSCVIGMGAQLIYLNQVNNEINRKDLCLFLVKSLSIGFISLCIISPIYIYSQQFFTTKIELFLYLSLLFFIFSLTYGFLFYSFDRHIKSYIHNIIQILKLKRQK